MLFPHHQMKMLHVFFCQGNRPDKLPTPSLDTEGQNCETVFLQMVQMLYPALVPPFPQTPLTWPGPGTTWLLLLLDLLEQEQHLLYHDRFLYCTTCWIKSSRMKQLIHPFPTRDIQGALRRAETGATPVCSTLSQVHSYAL